MSVGEFAPSEMPAKPMLIGLVGLPYSGKSTIARKMDVPIVCPDEIRLAMHGHRFIPEAEGMVWAIAHIMVNALFGAGHTKVVLDSCNASRKRRMEWEGSSVYDVFWTPVRTPMDVCIERAFAEDDEEIIPIIQRMNEAWDVPAVGEAWPT